MFHSRIKRNIADILLQNREMEKYKTYKHNPPHLFRPNGKYLITGAIYQKRNLLLSDESKTRLIESLRLGFNSRGWKLEEWVVLHNHYHIIAESSENVSTLPAIIQNVHKFTAMWLKKNCKEAKTYKKIWWNYWDTCITYESSYFARLNYLWNNPLKHGVTDCAETWKFGSYYYRIQEDKSYIEKLYDQYPFDGVNVKDDF